MRPWMKNAVASTLCLPSITLPSESVITRSAGVISDQCSPCGLIRKRSCAPGTARLKWLQTPSFKPSRAAHRRAAARSIRDWEMGSCDIAPESLTAFGGGGKSAPDKHRFNHFRSGSKFVSQFTYISIDGKSRADGVPDFIHSTCLTVRGAAQCPWSSTFTSITENNYVSSFRPCAYPCPVLRRSSDRDRRRL